VFNFGIIYIGVELSVFNYVSTYHICMILNMFVSNYVCLIMTVLIIFVCTEICWCENIYV
jgi:hypothetical protein